MNEQLLLRLPHRQFVFTIPKVLRVFFRHDRRLHGEISRLVYGLVRDFATAAAGKRIRAAAVVVFQSSGEFLRWNPHWRGLFLEGGFDRQGRFVHLPTVDLDKISACFRQRVIAFFLQSKLLNERLAKSMVQWTHSGFSVDSSVRIPAGSTKAREALSQYIVRPPISLQKLLVDEGRDAVVYRAPYSDYFRTDSKISPPTAFLAELLQHLPDARNRLIRCYDLYSSRARGTWSHTPHLLPLAPEGWRHNHPPRPTLRLGPPDEHQEDCSVAARQSRSAWARLIKKLYEVDPLGGSWPRSGQREPPDLLSLWPTHEGAPHHHRPPAGTQDPAPSGQDRKATTRPGPRVAELIPRSWLHPGDQSVLASRDAQIYGLPRPRRHTLSLPSARFPSRPAAHPCSPSRARPVRGKFETSGLPIRLRARCSSCYHLQDRHPRKVGMETITVPAATFNCEHWKSDYSDFWVSTKVSPFSLVKDVGNNSADVLVKTIESAKDHITGPVKPYDAKAVMQYMKELKGKQ